MKRKMVVLIVVLLVVTGIILVCMYTDGCDPDTILQLRHQFKTWILQMPVLAAIVFLMLYSLIVATPAPSLTVMTLMGGFLFGIPIGFLLSISGAVIAATISFLLSRHYIGSWVMRKYPAAWRKFENAFENHQIRYLITVRFLLGPPYFLINLLAGLTKTRIFTYIWTTFLGMSPVVLFFTFAGRQLDKVESYHDIVSWKVLFSFASVALIFFIPVFWEHYRNHSTKNHKEVSS